MARIFRSQAGHAPPHKHVELHVVQPTDGFGPHPALRPTASIRDCDGQPLDRDEYARLLQEQASEFPTDERLALLSEDEAVAVAALLYELHGVYADERLGRLACDLAARINARLG